MSSHLQSCFDCRCIVYALAALVHSGSKCNASQLQDLMLSIFEQLLMSKIATQRLVAGLVLSLWANFDQVTVFIEHWNLHVYYTDNWVISPGDD